MKYLLFIMTFVGLFFLFFFMLFSDPGANYRKRLTQIKVPTEIIKIDSLTDTAELNIVKNYFRKGWIENNKLDSCFVDSIPDFKVESFLPINEDSKIYFIVFTSARYNLCNDKKEFSYMTINCIPLYIDKKERHIEYLKICQHDSFFDYKTKTINDKDLLYKLTYELEVVRVLETYKYYKFVFLFLKIKSKDFLSNIIKGCE